MKESPARADRPRDFRVDVLRGLSIVSVLVLHFQLAYRLLKSPLGRFLPEPYLSNLVWNGNYGVTVFFVISGYLITSTSMRRFGGLERVSPRVFYAFRFARIIPCLLLVLAIITALAIAGVQIFRNTGDVPLWLTDLSVLTFWHNVMMSKYGYFNYCINIFWSLSVEEVFYIAFPLLCVMLRKPRWIVPVWLAAIVAGPIYRSFNSHNEIRFLYGYLACFDAIAMGCIVAVAVRNVKAGWMIQPIRMIMQLVSLLFMTWIFLRAGIDTVPVWGTSLMALGAAVFLYAEGACNAAEGSSMADKLVSPIAWFGKHSYELYLFHIVLLAGMRSIPMTHTLSPESKPFWFVVFVGCSAVVAWGIARFYSEPLNRRLRARLAPSVTAQ